jgi:hypothetical protein
MIEPLRGRSVYYLGKMNGTMTLLKSAWIIGYKDSHQFSCKILIAVDRFSKYN